MMRVYAIAGIALLLIGCIAWIEKGAVAKVEAARYAEAVKIQKASISQVQARSKVEQGEYRQELAEAQAMIDQLHAEAALVPDTQGTDAYCVPGCKVRWQK